MRGVCVGGGGVQWGICHVAMFGSLPANKYCVLCWSTACVGREEVPHLASASGNAINPVGKLWHLLQVAFAPNSYLVTTRISCSLPNPPFSHTLSFTVLVCLCLGPAVWLIKIKSEIKANKIHGNVARLVQ